jgi:hypothetical protein
MKKKTAKAIILKDSDLSKANVTILEANQSQQTIILKFFTENNLSKYSLAICKISPLLNSPEKVELIIFSPIECPIELNQKVYLIFGKEPDSKVIDEEDDIVLHINIEEQFEVKEDEVLTLIESDSNQQKIIDWCKPIIDEPVSPETLEVLKDRVKHLETSGPKYYKRKELVEKNNDKTNSKKVVINKRFLWILFFIALISMFEFISVFSLSEKFIPIFIKTVLMLLKNFLLGIFLFKWINSTNKHSAAFLISGILIITIILFISYFIGLYPSILSGLILSFIVITFALRFNKH